MIKKCFICQRDRNDLIGVSLDKWKSDKSMLQQIFFRFSFIFGSFLFPIPVFFCFTTLLDSYLLFVVIVVIDLMLVFSILVLGTVMHAIFYCTYCTKCDK